MNLFIACPVYQRDHPMNERSIRATVDRFRGAAVAHRIRGESCLARARATMFAEFLEHKRPWTHLLQVDDDQSWDPDHLEAMLGLDLPVVGLPIAYKFDEPHEYAGYATIRGIRGEAMREDGTVKVQYLGGGFILWRADVLQAMVDQNPHLGFDTNSPGMPSRPTAHLWAQTIVDRELLSEDYHACRLASQAGYEIRAWMGACSPHWAGDRTDRANEKGTWKAYVPWGYYDPITGEPRVREAA